MGRRPAGRKYSKHISIQVLDEHNNDLKLLTARLNELAPFPNNKKWTIRDVILTLFYGFCKDGVDPEWFSTFHFENISHKKLKIIRNNITTKKLHTDQTDGKSISKKNRNLDSNYQTKKRKKKSSKNRNIAQNDIQNKPMGGLSFSINPDIIVDLEKRKTLTGEVK